MSHRSVEYGCSPPSLNGSDRIKKSCRWAPDKKHPPGFDLDQLDVHRIRVRCARMQAIDSAAQKSEPILCDQLVARDHPDLSLHVVSHRLSPWFDIHSGISCCSPTLSAVLALPSAPFCGACLIGGCGAF